MTIVISAGTTDYEFYNVPDKVGKAIITLLQECEKDDSKIVSAERERWKMNITEEVNKLIADYFRRHDNIINSHDVKHEMIHDKDA